MIHQSLSDALEAFIRGEDNETLVGTEEPVKRTLRKLAGARTGAAVKAAAAAQ